MKAKFEENPLPPPIKKVGYFPCNDCIYHRCAYFKSSKYFEFKANDKSMTWHHKHYFNCDSKNLIYWCVTLVNGFILDKQPN